MTYCIKHCSIRILNPGPEWCHRYMLISDYMGQAVWSQRLMSRLEVSGLSSQPKWPDLNCWWRRLQICLFAVFIICVLFVKINLKNFSSFLFRQCFALIIKAYHAILSRIDYAFCCSVHKSKCIANNRQAWWIGWQQLRQILKGSLKWWWPANLEILFRWNVIINIQAIAVFGVTHNFIMAG